MMRSGTIAALRRVQDVCDEARDCWALWTGSAIMNIRMSGSQRQSTREAINALLRRGKDVRNLKIAGILSCVFSEIKTTMIQ